MYVSEGWVGKERKEKIFFTMCLLRVLHSVCEHFVDLTAFNPQTISARYGCYYLHFKHLVSSGTDNLKQGLNVFKNSTFFFFPPSLFLQFGKVIQIKIFWFSINWSILRFFSRIFFLCLRKLILRIYEIFPKFFIVRK